MQYITCDSSLEILGLSVRSFNALNTIGIKTVGQLIAIPVNDLYGIRNFGKKV